jgi:hypothetical protein
VGQRVEIFSVHIWLALRIIAFPWHGFWSIYASRKRQLRIALG